MRELRPVTIVLPDIEHAGTRDCGRPYCLTSYHRPRRYNRSEHEAVDKLGAWTLGWKVYLEVGIVGHACGSIAFRSDIQLHEVWRYLEISQDTEKVASGLCLNERRYQEGLH